ncbi:hypothetical protein MJ579_25115 [Klebsiella pneumoniae]|nr:hypothetical protein MJ579_25115 [Klebsiella pneumoniae]
MGSMHTGLEELPGRRAAALAAFTPNAPVTAALIVAGGIAPAPSGVTMAGGAVLNDASHLAHHRHITDAVHQEGGKIALQILHRPLQLPARWWPPRRYRRRSTTPR